MKICILLLRKINKKQKLKRQVVRWSYFFFLLKQQWLYILVSLHNQLPNPTAADC